MARALAYELARETYRFDAASAPAGAGSETTRRWRAPRRDRRADATRARRARSPPTDNVAVALRPLEPASVIDRRRRHVSGRAQDDSRRPQDRAARARRRATSCTSTAVPIGLADAPRSQPGDWIHSHNLRDRARRASLDYTYEPTPRADAPPGAAPTFKGYQARRRPRRHAQRAVGPQHGRLREPRGGADRQAGGRAVRRRDRRRSRLRASVRLQPARRRSRDTRSSVLAGLMRHPNAGGVLVLGLGCENNQMDELLATGRRRRSEPDPRSSIRRT